MKNMLSAILLLSFLASSNLITAEQLKKEPADLVQEVSCKEMPESIVKAIKSGESQQLLVALAEHGPLCKHNKTRLCIPIYKKMQLSSLSSSLHRLHGSMTQITPNQGKKRLLLALELGVAYIGGILVLAEHNSLLVFGKNMFPKHSHYPLLVASLGAHAHVFHAMYKLEKKKMQKVKESKLAELKDEEAAARYRAMLKMIEEHPVDTTCKWVEPNEKEDS